MKNSGFTLVELLVAIAILALVAVLGYRGLDGIVRTRETLTAQMETTRGLQLAFAQMQSDGEHLAGQQELGRAMLAADTQRLMMVRTVYAENQPARLQVVTYRIENGTLTRRESLATRDLRELDVMWAAAVSNTDPSTPIVLQTGVNAIAVRIFDTSTWRQPRQPGQVRRAETVPDGVAAVGNRPGLPAGLEVALQVQGQKEPMTKVFLVGGV